LTGGTTDTLFQVDQNIRFFKQILRFGDDLPLEHKLFYAGLIAAHGKAFIQAGIELAFKFFE
jgi:hypothetical protein